jgi:hypothetical protein
MRPLLLLDNEVVELVALLWRLCLSAVVGMAPIPEVPRLPLRERDTLPPNKR